MTHAAFAEARDEVVEVLQQQVAPAHQARPLSGAEAVAERRFQGVRGQAAQVVEQLPFEIRLSCSGLVNSTSRRNARV